MNIEQQIYTSCPYGKGYDGISGFQVKARSKGITDSMSRALLPYSNHYQVPRELRNLEYRYYQEGKDLPPEILDRFPITVTYHPVEANFFGLTRIRYLGKDFTGRAGNFYSHTLVFEPEALEPFDYNPIALSRSGAFATSPGEGTELDSWPDFHPYAPGAVKPAGNWMAIVNKGPYTASYEAVLTAVVNQLCQDQPIILCFKEYEEALNYIESLLMMLPPVMRCRVTFTSYEPDPYLLIKRGGRKNQENHLHLLTTLQPGDGGSFEFRPHEINRFLVWDFAGEHYSKFPGPTLYTQTVIKLCIQGQPDRLSRCHHLLEQVGAALVPGYWDVLIQAEELENKLSEIETRRIVPTVLDTFERISLDEPQVDQALALTWPLLQKTALEETDDLFPRVCKTVERLLDRLPKESARRQDLGERLMGLVCNVIASYNIPRAHILASLDYGTPGILSRAASFLEKTGWPQLSGQTGEPDFARILGTLEQLAQEQGMSEWVVQTIWQKVKSLAETILPGNYYGRLLEMIEALREKLPPGADLTGQVAHEASDLIQHLLKKGFPARALRMIELSQKEAQEVIPDVYRRLLDEDWPAHFTINPDTRDEDRKALRKILEVVIRDIIKENPMPGAEFQDLLPVFRIAHRYSFADELWLNFKTHLQGYLSEPSDSSTAISFVKSLNDILEKYRCPEEIFQLLIWQTKIEPPGSLQEWKQRIEKLTRQVVCCQAPVQRLNELLKLIDPPLSRNEHIILLAIIFHESVGFPQVKVIIGKKYEAILESLSTPGEVWEIRSVMAQEGQATWDLLMKDFIDSLIPWSEKGKECLQEWQTWFFSKNPAIISFASNFLAKILREGKYRRDELTLSLEYLVLFGESSKEQCLPLSAAFIAKAPIETVVSNWKPWFARADPHHQLSTEANQRADLISWLKKIETKKSTGEPDSQAAIKYLQNWAKHWEKLDPEAREWAAQRLLDLFGTVDLSSTKKYRVLIKKSLRKYRENDLQEAINYLLHEFGEDPVNRVLQLMVIGQAGMERVKEPDGKILAEIMFEVTKHLPADKGELSWKLLADRAEKCDPPAVEAFRHFRRLAKPTAQWGRKGRRLFERVFKRKSRGNDKTEKKIKEENMNKKKRLVWFWLITVILLIGLTGCIERDASSFTGTASFGDDFWHGLFFTKLPDSSPSTSGYGWGVGIGCVWSILACIGGLIYGVAAETNILYSIFWGYQIGLLKAALVYGLVALIIWIF